MDKFATDKHGYNMAQVDKYISDIKLKYESVLTAQTTRFNEVKAELEQTKAELNKYLSKDKEISRALISATEKADEITAQTQKVCALELQRIKIMYETWRDVIDELQDIEEVQRNSYLQEVFRVFNNTLDKTINSGDKTRQNEQYIKTTLQNMKSLIKEKEKVQQHLLSPSKHYAPVDISEFVGEHQKENNRINSIGDKLKHISLKAGQSNSGDFVEDSAYARSIRRSLYTPNESGFDLNEALNPKEDLEEIMKAFDLGKKDNK